LTTPSSQPPKKLPGEGLFGWLGRQFGHVKNAVGADVTKETIYRNTKTEEKEMPENPNVKLRRTVIDEVVVNRGDPKPNEPKQP
jgi:hypothetical protein